MQRSPRNRVPSGKVTDVNNAANPLTQKAKSGGVKGLVQTAKKIGGKILPRRLSPQTQPRVAPSQPRPTAHKTQSQPVGSAAANLQELTKVQKAEKARKKKLAEDRMYIQLIYSFFL